jgi:hypothetical protein
MPLFCKNGITKERNFRKEKRRQAPSMSSIADFLNLYSRIAKCVYRRILVEKEVQLARMTSFDKNLFDKQSKSLRSNLASGRVFRYDSEHMVSIVISSQSSSGLTMLRDMIFHFSHCVAYSNVVV